MNCNNIKWVLINPKSIVCLIAEFIKDKNKSKNLIDYTFAFTIIFVVWSLIAILLFTLIGTKPIFEYSQGEVTGKPVKLSKKGLVFKTTEGYLMTGGISDGSATKWYFTVTDNKLVECINNNDNVTLTYTQYLLVPAKVGDTHYIVTSCKAK